jgi:hypothetical protein
MIIESERRANEHDKLGGILACVTCLLFVSLFPQSNPAQGKTASLETNSPQGFVQAFYSWYVPIALNDAAPNTPAASRALTQRAPDFSPVLVRSLRGDFEAQSKANGEIVGLDFDPFLAAQDPCESYVVGSTSRRGFLYMVPVFGVCSGVKHRKPDVVAELVRRHGSWLFVNFLYPSNKADLMSTLKLLREQREKHPN